MAGDDKAAPTPAAIHVRTRDVMWTGLGVLAVILATSFVTAQFVDDPPPPAPVVKITRGEIRRMTNLLANLQHDRHLTAAERALVRQAQEIVDAVDHGDIRIVETPTSGAPAPVATSPPTTSQVSEPPPVSTSTTTTTAPPPGSRQNPIDLPTLPPVVLP